MPENPFEIFIKNMNMYFDCLDTSCNAELVFCDEEIKLASGVNSV